MVFCKYQGKALKVFLCLHRVHATWNDFEGQKWSGQPSKSWLRIWMQSLCHVVRRDALSWRGWTIFCVLYLFLLILPGTAFTKCGKILFLKNLAIWVASVRFWLEKWSLEYQGVCIMPGVFFNIMKQDNMTWILFSFVFFFLPKNGAISSDN